MKVVLIGASGHTGYVVNSVKSLKNIELKAIAPGPEEDITHFASSLKQSFPNIEVFENYIEMLDKIKPDIAGITPIFCYHSKVAIECIKRGIHCFIEKPLATDIRDLDLLYNTYQKSNVHLTGMFSMRYTPHYWAAYKVVKDGIIGEPILITAQKSYKLGKRRDFYKSRRTYGGTIPWVGSHSIDWIYWFTDGRLKSVYANHTTKGNKDHNDLESSAVCMFLLKNGGQAVTNIDYFRPDKAPTHGDDRLRVAGENGIVEVMNEKAVLVTHNMPPKELELEDQPDFFGEFVSQIEGKGTCRVSAEDAFKVTEICLKARESADKNRVIEL